MVLPVHTESFCSVLSQSVFRALSFFEQNSEIIIFTPKLLLISVSIKFQFVSVLLKVNYPNFTQLEVLLQFQIKALKTFMTNYQ